MKIIPKGQNGLVVKSDNTKVVQRPVIFPIKYKIKPLKKNKKCAKLIKESE